jgi:hypothetical protein
MSRRHVQTDDEKRMQLSKTLCYLLRHGLSVEGLKVYTGFYILQVFHYNIKDNNQDELLALPQLKRYTARDLDEVVKSSISIRFGTPRFEQLRLQDLVFIRAAVGQSGRKFYTDAIPTNTVINIEPFPVDLTSLRYAYKAEPIDQIPKLYTLCLKNIVKNIKQYDDFASVGDSSIVESIMKECKSQNKLNNANLKLFLIDKLDRLDIGNSAFLL